MPGKPRTKNVEVANPTEVDIDLAAQAFTAGRRAEKLKLGGEDLMRVFVGCITQLRPETDKFEAHRYMGKALTEAHGMGEGEDV